MRQRRKFFIGNLIEPMDMAAILLAELREPDVGAFRNQHGVRHPCGVGTELLVLMRRVTKDRDLRLADDGRPLLCTALAAAARGLFSGSAHAGCIGIELHPDRQLFFVQDFAAHHQEAVHGFAEQRTPQFADEGELIG